MSDVVSCAEIDGQYVELLQARTLLQTGVLGNVVGVVNDVATVKVDSAILSGNSASAGSPPSAPSAPSGDQ
ncbi:MAG: hypothetical protein ACRDTC_28180 [Pseudonocardiaceae bacterium]